MCGILAFFSKLRGPILDITTSQVLKQSKKIRHRGPDWNGISSLYSKDGQPIVLAHERLAIIDPFGGEQPINTKGISLAVNGEIYNYKQLIKDHNITDLVTGSDCEPILHLYDPDNILTMLNELRGMFAFVLYDSNTGTYLVARDRIGIIPLYYGIDHSGGMWFCSEMKGLQDVCDVVKEFPPGNYFHGSTYDRDVQGQFYRYNYACPREITQKSDPTQLAKKLEDAVVSHMMCDVPFGVLLSGGLDSSLVASLVCRHRQKRIEDDERTDAWFPNIHTFSVGIKGSPDLENAQKVADFLGTIHHQFEFTIQEALNALEDVIQQLETFDITTIRASTPMYLLSRRIKAMGIKMVLSGEGADEIFGGYLYFHKAPNPKEFHDETIRKMDKLHMYDCLRANKSTMAWGIEARVPFLDRDFVDYSMQLDPELKMCHEGYEKYMLRKAFDDDTYLPKEVLWRRKEQFSDGVGYSWIDTLKELAESKVTDEQLKNASDLYEYCTPITKEGYMYREIFSKFYPEAWASKLVPDEISIACSTSHIMHWDESFKDNADPSGRSVQL